MATSLINIEKFKQHEDFAQLIKFPNSFIWDPY